MRGVGSSYLPHFFTAHARPSHFASLVVTVRCYKAGGRSCAQPTSSHMISHRLYASFPMAYKVLPLLPF
jgi:hypothetical protein